MLLDLLDVRSAAANTAKARIWAVGVDFSNEPAALFTVTRESKLPLVLLVSGAVVVIYMNAFVKTNSIIPFSRLKLVLVDLLNRKALQNIKGHIRARIDKSFHLLV